MRSWLRICNATRDGQPRHTAVAGALLVMTSAIAWPGGRTACADDPKPRPKETPQASEPSTAAPTQPGQPGATPRADQPSRPAAPSNPTLDDLLGTAGDPPADAPRDEHRVEVGGAVEKELERRLTAQEMGDQFEQAIRLMGDAAEQLERRRDVGLSTQRIQEDVLRKLDEIIAQIDQNQQQQQQSSSSSSSKSKQDPSQSQQQSSKNKKQKGAKGEKGREKAEAGTTDDPQGAQAPGLQTGTLRPALESAPAAWGSLPVRVRDMLLQGAGDKFSTTWEKATENYYRRLAEEQKAP